MRIRLSVHRVQLVLLPSFRRCLLRRDSVLLGVVLCFLVLILRQLISMPNRLRSLATTRDVFIYASFFYKNSTSLAVSPQDSVAILFLANRNDDFPYLRCAISNSSSARLMPAQLFRLDYVAVCDLIIFVAWCNFPPNSFHANPHKAFVDLGTQVLADQSLREQYTRPILHKIRLQRPDGTPRNLVMCISRIFAFEKWELLIAAMEVYKALGVDLVVTHVYSALTPVFELIRAYEAEGRLAIRTGVRLPYLRGLMNSDPERQLEYSGQLTMAHECFYEFRESSSFISLVDWDDLLITTRFPSLSDALVSAARKYPNSAYFFVNKLESGIRRKAIEDRSPSNFRLKSILRNSVFTKKTYNSEKLVIRPSRVDGFWIHFTRHYAKKHEAIQLPVQYAMILHLSREINGTEDAYGDNVLSALWHSKRMAEGARRFFTNRTVARIMHSLPSQLHYFNSIRHCSLFLNAFPDVAPPPPCLSYSLCPFPRISVPCTVAKTHFRMKTIEPTRVYRVHVRQWSRFERRSDGCF
uniref:Glycosyltransferase family 92 protein n=1 Tax=Globodera rostochiensis TaxID=31243 RepID=A0A914HJV3_GLORO